MAKTQDKTAAAQARDAARKTARWSGSMILWIIPLALVAWGLWMLFKPQPPGYGQASTVEQMVLNYTDFVRPYTPPSSLSPTQDTVEDWLQFFDSDSRRWFNDSVDKLSFVMFQNDVETWKQFVSGRRRIEAMRFLLGQGPLRGGSLGNVRYGSDGNAAVVELFTGSATVPVPAVKVGSFWRFKDFMGQRAAIQQRIDAITLPPR